MHPLIYDVAVSLDGYIAAADGSFDRFPADGPMVAGYLERLATYGTVLMGRATYDVGLAHGLPLGATPYPHMDGYLISDTLSLPPDAAIRPLALDPDAMRALKAQARAPLYLCGGGQLAGWALRHGLIDQIILKCAPILLGEGIPLFRGVTAPPELIPLDETCYGNGQILRRFIVQP